MVLARRSRHSRLTNRSTSSRLYVGLGIIIRSNGCFEGFVVFSVF